MVRRVTPVGEALVWCSKCSGHARCRLGAEADEPLQTRKKVTNYHGNIENNIQIRRRKGARQERETVES